MEGIDRAYNRLITLGAVENEKPFSVGGEILTATVFDPFGNLLGLIYNPSFRAK